MQYTLKHIQSIKGDKPHFKIINNFHAGLFFVICYASEYLFHKLIFSLFVCLIFSFPSYIQSNTLLLFV